MDSLPPVQRATTLWLLDLLCAVADNEAETRMDAHNLGEWTRLAPPLLSSLPCLHWIAVHGVWSAL